jgi:hypothetical protein
LIQVMKINVMSISSYVQVLSDRFRKRHPLGSAFVNAYNARPMLHLRSERNRRYDSYSFVEAVLQEETPTNLELKGAYRIAGKSFRGKLRKTFIVLQDDHVPEANTPPAKAAKPGSSKDGKKKRRASDDNSTVKKKIPSTQ